MLDLHMTRFIHDHDSSTWRTHSSIWRIRCRVYASISFSLYYVLYVICKSSRILSKMLRFFLSLSLPAICTLHFWYSLFSVVVVAIFVVFPFVLLKLGWYFLFLLSLLIFVCFVCSSSHAFSSFIDHTICLKIVFSVVFLLSWCAYIFLYWSLCFAYLLIYLFIYFTIVCSVCSIFYLVVVSFILSSDYMCACVQKILPMSVLANIKLCFCILARD